jgi:hypothetical protein
LSDEGDRLRIRARTFYGQGKKKPALSVFNTTAACFPGRTRGMGRLAVSNPVDLRLEHKRPKSHTAHFARGEVATNSRSSRHKSHPAAFQLIKGSKRLRNTCEEATQILVGLNSWLNKILAVLKSPLSDLGRVCNNNP